jgi:hypothetical protein
VATTGLARTAKDAEAAGYRRSSRRPSDDDGKGWIHIAHAHATAGEICYIGPCNEGETTRPVCYLDDEGSCDDCWDEEDHACGG